MIARNSTEIYKGKPVDVRQIGKELGVRYVLEGSIRIEGERVRVASQLIEAASGAHVWAQRFDRPLADLFAVQSEVAEAVAAALGGSFNIGAVAQHEAERMRRKPPASLDAYDLYLIGVEGKAVRTKESVTEGLSALDRAIALEPGLARAYVTRGWLHFFSTTWDVPWSDGIERMGDDMRKAFELDPRDSDVRAGLGTYYSFVGDLGKSESLIREALDLNPNSVHVLVVAASNMPYFGHPDEAVALADKALRLDPRMVPANLFGLKDAYYFSRHFERAISVIDRIPEENRSSMTTLFLAASHAFLGHAHEGAAAKAKYVAQWPDDNAQLEYSYDVYFARQAEIDLFFETFRVLGLPMCATPEQLKKIAKPYPLPECQATGLYAPHRE